MPFKNAETDSLIVKYHEFISAQKAAQELMKQGHEQQAIASYVAISARILEIEIELTTRHQRLSICHK